MSNKRKGQLTTDFEWRKHLRKIGKRFFWNGERIAEKKMIRENLYESEIRNINEIPVLTFDELFDLVEENRFDNEIYNKIAEKILEAERDWRTSIETINEFIIILEKEVNGLLTKSSLDKLLKKYNQNINQYAWEAESVCYLLDIFELTKETEMRKIIVVITKNIKAK